MINHPFLVIHHLKIFKGIPHFLKSWWRHRWFWPGPEGLLAKDEWICLELSFRGSCDPVTAAGQNSDGALIKHIHSSNNVWHKPITMFQPLLSGMNIVLKCFKPVTYNLHQITSETIGKRPHVWSLQLQTRRSTTTVASLRSPTMMVTLAEWQLDGVFFFVNYGDLTI